MACALCRLQPQLSQNQNFQTSKSIFSFIFELPRELIFDSIVPWSIQKLSTEPIKASEEKS